MSTTSSDEALIAALWRVIAAHGWPGLTMRRLAAEAGIDTASLRERFPTRLGLLLLHGRMMDQAVLAGTIPGQGGTERDRIFDVLMRRLDAMQPHREGILRLFEDMRRDPALALALAPHIGIAMRWMLEAAEVEGKSCEARLLALGLAGVWLATIRAWARDDSPDMGATMAALDSALDRAERIARPLGLLRGEATPAPAAEAAETS
ncbi:MAG: TetR family transcriptional regulator [Roseomonas sp.]|jgi:ubiquinone biosynthesis protein COQ9|nr:TetR family transcriptional regulator [Roseomonas sp.]MCA3370306.1 TetR family transcriptional regulator [Roseomonas sp.]MCE2759928.1 TetR/AcrR family transcriptional regulator [Acetobacteraceae bacterium]